MSAGAGQHWGIALVTHGCGVAAERGILATS